MGESIRTQIANDFNAAYDRFEAGKKRLWHRLRRHGWRIERCEAGVDWYRGEELINVWLDWLDGEVDIEQGRWINVPVKEGFALRKVMLKRQRVSFEDFEKGNYKI